MATLRDVARAQIAFSNGLLLENSALAQTIATNLPAGSPNVELAEESQTYGAHHIQLVEDPSLNTIWLGFRVAGEGEPNDVVRIQATSITGPGLFSAFTTGTFGNPTLWMSSADGVTPEDSLELPTNAHTHMSWGFSAPGEYKLGLEALLVKPDGGETSLGSGTVRFAVGDEGDGEGEADALHSGHVDITADLAGGLTFEETDERGERAVALDEAFVHVPYSVATTVPDPKWSFLGEPGDEAWVLAQAVLGKHVHGEIDPHLWHDVRNAIAYVEVIRDRLTQVDPARAEEYQANAAAYIAKLRGLDEWAAQVLGSIPAAQRKIVTAHDSFGYLAQAYGVEVAGFVAPNPSMEPSVQTLANLARTLGSLEVPAVFLEPTSPAHAGELVNVAREAGARFCSIYADTLTDEVASYTEMVEFNVKSLKSCLDPGALGAWDPQ